VKGIVLAGGSGTRLWPITKGVSKQLLPVYDKPLIYYPIATLMLAGIRDILIITTPQDSFNFRELLGNGEKFGIHLEFATQEFPNGIAESFIIGEEFIDNQNVALILGDNIFHGWGLGSQLQQFTGVSGAQIFCYPVLDPKRYGILEFGEGDQIRGIEEKPINPKSNLAIAGLYFYDSQVCEFAKALRPSARGELEITSINQMYLDLNKLHATRLERGTVWLDTGTPESLFAASSYVKVIEERQGLKIACLEEIAWKKGWLDIEKLTHIAKQYHGSEYGHYLDLLITSNQ